MQNEVYKSFWTKENGGRGLGLQREGVKFTGTWKRVNVWQTNVAEKSTLFSFGKRNKCWKSQRSNSEVVGSFHKNLVGRRFLPVLSVHDFLPHLLDSGSGGYHELQLSIYINVGSSFCQVTSICVCVGVWIKSKGKPSARILLSCVGEFITQALFFHLLCTLLPESNKQRNKLPLCT